MLAVNDDCCRENLCLMADTSISGARVARELDALVRVYGKPACIVSDNGTEFTSRAILKWAGDNDVDWHYIDRECPIFCVIVIWSMLPERSKDDDHIQGTAGRTTEGLRAA